MSSGHSVQSNPKAVLEVRRILREHAEGACRQKGIGCVEAPPRVSERAETIEPGA